MLNVYLTVCSIAEADKPNIYARDALAKTEVEVSSGLNARIQ